VQYNNQIFDPLLFNRLLVSLFVFFFFSLRFALPPLPPPSCRQCHAVTLPPPP
jgi:hypothetical protein